MSPTCTPTPQEENRCKDPDESERAFPLCVDLDGTLIKTDLLWEGLRLVLLENCLYLFLIPFWLLRGKAYMKEQIATRVAIKAHLLPYTGPFVEWLKQEAKRGRRLILVTGSNRHAVNGITEHLGLFTRCWRVTRARTSPGSENWPRSSRVLVWVGTTTPAIHTRTSRCGERRVTQSS